MTDFVLKSNVTGEVIGVFDPDGYDPSEWEVVDTVLPADVGVKPYTLVGNDFVPVVQMIITQAEFLALFTVWEQAMAANSTDAAMKTTLMLLQAHQVVHLDDPRVDDGLTLMVSLSIIDETRKARVLSNLPPE